MHNNVQQSIVPEPLLNQWREAKKQHEISTNNLKSIEKEINNLTSTFMENTLKEEGKDYGQKTLDIGQFKLTLGVEEKRKYDQTKLEAIAQTLTPEQFSSTFNMKLEVPKAKFNVLNDGDLRTRINSACVITYAPKTPKIEFKG